MTKTTPTAPLSVTRPTPLVAHTFGEPRFHTDADIAAVAFAADNSIVSVDDAGVFRQWTADGHILRRQYLSDLETLWRFSPDVRCLASGNDDLLLWNVSDGQLIDRIQLQSWVTAIAFSPDGRTVATGHDDGRVRFIDVVSRKPIGEINAHSNAVSALSFAPSGDRLASAGEDRIVRIWDA